MNAPNLIGGPMKQSTSPRDQNLEHSVLSMVPMSNHRPRQWRNSPDVMGHCLSAYKCQHVTGTVIPTMKSSKKNILKDSWIVGFLDSWILEVALHKIINDICRLICSVYY